MTGKQLKDSILQWAIQGKLVPQDPNDEPASVLLEKIRAEKARLIKEGKIKKDKKESIIYRGEDNSYYEKISDGKVVCIDDEIPFEVPCGWEWCRLGSISSIYGGKRIPAGRKLSTSDTGHKYIRVSDMKNSSVFLDNIQYVTEDIYQLIKAYTISKDDLYITVAGTIGSVGEIPDELDNANLTENADKIVFSIIDKRFLMYTLQSELVQSQIKECTTKVGQPKLAIMRIQGFLIALPPLNEQKKIVHAVEEVIPYISKYEQAQIILEKLNTELKEKIRKSILQEAIQGKLVPQNTSEEPATVLLQRIREEKQRLVAEGKLKKKDVIDSTIFRGDDNKYYEQIGQEQVEISDAIPFDLPDSWQWVRFGQIVRMCIGKTPARGDVRYWLNATKHWVSISDMADYGHIRSTKEKISDSAASDVMGSISPVGSLLMSFKLTVGRTSILDIEAYHNEAIISIYPFVDEEYALRDYLFYTLPVLANMGDSKDAIKGKTLNSKSLNSLLIPLPPLKEQIRIVNNIEELSKKMKGN